MKARQRDPVRRAWYNAIHRCHHATDVGYRFYGGRGIRVCDEWRASFESFRDHMGPMPVSTTGERYTLDRIDSNGNYEPGNVRWATYTQQANNRRNNVALTAAGETMTLSQWAQRLGMDRKAINALLADGFTMDQVVSGEAESRHTRNEKQATARQVDVLRFIRNHTNVHGYPPSVREIGKAIGVPSTNGVMDHIKALRKKQMLHESVGVVARQFRLTDAGVQAVQP